ncbi:hypothetical protein HGRIS_011788 [Hohenbuehelia grisea]|uniref:Uncharacterized protein n=1 Tax=Hohenbuehelia grisea TaxID=104357 RepID=A0ABR3JW65_9AGAR
MEAAVLLDHDQSLGRFVSQPSSLANCLCPDSCSDDAGMISSGLGLNIGYYRTSCNWRHVDRLTVNVGLVLQIKLDQRVQLTKLESSEIIDVGAIDDDEGPKDAKGVELFANCPLVPNINAGTL